MIQNEQLIPIVVNALNGAFRLSSMKAYSQVTINFEAREVVITVSLHWKQMSPFISIRVANDQFSKTSASKNLIAYTSLGLRAPNFH